MSASSAPPPNAAGRKVGTLGLLRRLGVTYLGGHRWKIALALSMAVLEGAANAAVAFSLGTLLDRVFKPDGADLLPWFAAFVFAVFVMRGLTGYIHQVTMNAVGQSVVARIQRQVYAHLIRADLAWLHGRASGELISRLVSDVHFMRAATVECLAGFIRFGLTLVALVIVMFVRDWILAAAAFVVFPVAAWVLGGLGNSLRKLAKRTQAELGGFSALLSQTLQGARHVKAYGMEAHEAERVGGVVERIRRLSTKSFRISASLLPLNETFSGIVVVGIILYGGYAISAGLRTPGELISFIGAFMLAYQPINALTKLNAQLQIGLAAAERVLELLDERPAVVDRIGARPLAREVHDISLENVFFRYPNGELALDGLSLEVPAGGTVALVGASGAGKSTVLNLIPRFYDVEAGRVTVGGNDVRDITLASLRGNIALVSQDTALFDDTVLANIAYGRLGATRQEIEEAARAAAAHEFILALPQGYDTPVGENGAKLSGGQRQRVAIARAMLKNAPILLLDEATSALDSQSERAVQEALRRLQQGRTTLVIAHRLSTIVDADRIYVLEQGRVVESGTHRELLRGGGPYSRYHDLQRTLAMDADAEADAGDADDREARAG